MAALLGPPTEREGGAWYHAVGDVGYALTGGQALVVEFDSAGAVERTRMLR